MNLIDTNCGHNRKIQGMGKQSEWLTCFRNLCGRSQNVEIKSNCNQ